MTNFNFDQFYNLGYQVLPNILSDLQVLRLKHRLDEIYQIQLSEFGEEDMALIGESDTVRAPFLYSDLFINLFSGVNISNSDRYGINNMFTLPFIKQQIDYPSILKTPTNDKDLNQLFGFHSREFDNVIGFRKYRLERFGNDK